MYKLKKFVLFSLFVLFTFSYTGLASATDVLSELPDVSKIDAPAVEKTIENSDNTQLELVEVKNDNNINEKILKIENLPKVKNVSSNIVNITANEIIIPKGDVFEVSFAQDFTTKNF